MSIVPKQLQTGKPVKDEFVNSYADNLRAESYSKLEFPNTYYLAYRDLPNIIATHTPVGKAIDFGCGTGRSTRFLKSMGYDTIGVDISEKMLEKARKQDKQGVYHLIEDGSLGNFPSNSRSLVLSVFTFDNLPGKEKRLNILKEMVRVISDEGKIVLLDSSSELYVNDWASFTTSIFPENRNAGSGDIVQVQMEDVEDKRPVEDVIWFENDYRELFSKARLDIVKVYKPIAKVEEPFNWINETKVAPWVIYVLEKK